MSRDVHSSSHWLKPRNPPSSPAFGLKTRGDIGQPRLTTSPCNPPDSAIQEIYIRFVFMSCRYYFWVGPQHWPGDADVPLQQPHLLYIPQKIVST